jgi:exodeoxyribonuclease VII large subunit
VGVQRGDGGARHRRFARAGDLCRRARDGLTIADLVADLRAPTPSAAAEAAVPDGAAVRAVLAGLRERMARCTREQVDAAGEAAFTARLDLREAARRLTEGRRERIGAAAGRLHALSPLATLARGFAVPLDTDGRVLRRVKDLHTAERFRLRVVDGTVDCRVAD